MSTSPYAELSRRERQVMEILHRRKRATVSEILDELPADVTDGAVRSVLRLLRQKELVTYLQDGKRYVYEPAVRDRDIQRNAVKDMVSTFFDGSRERAMATLLGLPGRIDDATYDELRRLIDQAQSGKRKS